MTRRIIRPEEMGLTKVEGVSFEDIRKFLKTHSIKHEVYGRYDFLTNAPRVQQHFRDSEIILDYLDGLRLNEDDTLHELFRKELGEPARYINRSYRGARSQFGSRRNLSEPLELVETYLGVYSIGPDFNFSNLDGIITFQNGFLVERTRLGWLRYPEGTY